MNSNLPKVLHQVCGTEMIRLVVRSTRKVPQIERTILVVAPEAETLIRKTLGNEVEYIVQSQPLGTADALLQTQPDIQKYQNVIALLGDVPLISTKTIESLINLHLQGQEPFTLLTATPGNPEGLGRVIRDPNGDITAVVDENNISDSTPESGEVDLGVYCFRSSWLWPTIKKLDSSPKGEKLLTDMVSAATKQDVSIVDIQTGRNPEAIGIDTKSQLASAEKQLRDRETQRWMIAGVTMPDPSTVYLDLGIQIDQDVTLHPNTHIKGTSRIGQGSQIGPNATICNSTIGPHSQVNGAVVEDSTLENDVSVGLSSHIRSGSHLKAFVRVGNSVEVKSSELGQGTKCGHFSYIGDAHIGDNVNIGAGTVTCNFDGSPNKKKTLIGSDVLIGSASMLVAPLKIGPRARTGAGTVVTRDIPPNTLVYGVPAKIQPRNDSPTSNTDISKTSEYGKS